MAVRRLLAPGIAVLLLAGCSRPAAPVAPPVAAGPAWLADVTAEVGLDFVHDAGPTGSFFMPQIMGGGAALFDADGDGRLDVFLVQSAGPDARATHRLYRQGEGGTLTDVSKGSGLDVAGYGAGVAVGDVNNDGRPDVAVTEYGGLRLFLNRGPCAFTEVTQESGLKSLLWGTSAAFTDYDRDGRLDLVVVHYVAYDAATPCHDGQGRRDYCHPRQFPGTVTQLFRNLGPSGAAPVRFEDVTEKSGLGKHAGPGLGVVCADFTGDGWPDLFVANDGQVNRLWVNQQDGTFRDEAAVRGLALDGMGHAPANMGVGLGDVDGDGLFDLFVTHLTDETHTLWMQRPRGFFKDRTVASGLAPPGSRGTGFGTAVADLNQDGAPDVAVVNGRVSRARPQGAEALGPFWSQYAENNQLFANDGSGRFQDIAAQNPAFCGLPGVYRGLAVGDLNGDGAPDLVVTALAGPARVFRNVVPNRGRGLRIRATDPALKRDAYGAEITVRAGQRHWTHWLNPASSYLCSNEPVAHFGLGDVQQIDAVEVLWPDGTRETFPGMAADRTATTIELRKGVGKPGPP